MIRKSLFVFLFLVFCAHGWAQADASYKTAVPDTTGKAPALSAPGTLLSAKETTSTQKALLDVLIAANENCIVLINDQEKKPVSKDTFLYLKLPPGIYRYSAKSQTTGDVYRDVFTVEEGKLNEVFIDLLYAMDVEKEQREKLNSQTTVAGTSSNQSSLGVQAQATNETAASNPQELSAVNSLLANMVPVSGGSFVMGNNRSPAADEAEHKVMVNPFLFGKYEVTQEQWERLMGYNPSLNKGCRDCPVENVSWEEVLKFIRKLNSLTNKRFRLPTEAEWEYVARLGGKDEIEKSGGVEEYIKKTAWNSSNAENRTHPVGTKQPNATGVYDLFGNVSEWCMDWYGAFFYKEDFTEKNPEGPPLGKDKIIRGGNYKDYLGDRLRPSFRNKMNPKMKGSEVGFRLVLEKGD